MRNGKTHPSKTINWEAILQRLLMVPHSKKDLELRLLERGCPEKTARQLLDRYEEYGTIDDKVYALLYIDSKNTYGIRRLRDELRIKGVSDGVIEDALAESEIDEVERAIDVANSAAHIHGITVHKIVGRLLRRGFSGSSIREALEQLDMPDTACEEQF